MARCGDSHSGGRYPARLDSGSSAPDEGHALAGLGRCAAAGGHTTRAEAMLRQAHEILQRIGAADAPAMLAELDALTSQDPEGNP